MKKGVSLIALMSTIIVLALITSVVVVSGSNILTKTERKEFATEILSIQKILSEKELTSEVQNVLGPKVIFNSTTVEDESTSNMLSEMALEPYISDTFLVKELYELDMNKLGVNNLRRGNKKVGAKDVYLYSKETGKVYYYKGEKIGSNMFYTFSESLSKDVENRLEDYYPKLAGLKFEGVNGEVSVAEDVEGYGNKYNVYVKVENATEIPTVRKEISDTVEEKYSRQSDTIEFGNTKIIRLNLANTKDLTEMQKTVVIKYDGKKVKYSLKRGDTVAPVIDKALINTQTYYVKTEYITNVYIDMKDVVTDDKSGVKEVKFLYGTKTKADFASAGNTVPNNSINVQRQNLDNPIKITIYAKDNAGNESIANINVREDIVFEAAL